MLRECETPDNKLLSVNGAACRTTADRFIADNVSLICSMLNGCTGKCVRLSRL